MNVTAEDRTNACPRHADITASEIPLEMLMVMSVVGEREVTVQPGLYTFDPVDEEIGLQSMPPTGRRDVPERVVW